VTSKPPKEHRGGLFGGRRELEAELERLQGQLDAFGFTERIALQAQLADLRSEVVHLAVERDALLGKVQPLRAELFSLRSRLDEAQRLLARAGELEAAQFRTGAAVAQMEPVKDQGAPRLELAELKRLIIEAS
jgi:chromosome segregation ATPase